MNTTFSPLNILDPNIRRLVCSSGIHSPILNYSNSRANAPTGSAGKESVSSCWVAIAGFWWVLVFVVVVDDVVDVVVVVDVDVVVVVVAVVVVVDVDVDVDVVVVVAVVV